jgi:hypothetical protein
MKVGVLPLRTVAVYSVRMAGQPECASGLLPHFAQGKAACACRVGFARSLSFVGMAVLDAVSRRALAWLA